MPDLPQIPRRLSTIQNPQAHTQIMSDAQAGAPYRILADSLTSIGETAEAIAKPLAERAGADAVTRNENGDLVVEQMPIIGPAGAVYARAARFAFLARAQPEIENSLTELRLKFPNDPEGYQIAAKQFTDNYVEKIPDPLLREPAGKIALETAAQNYRGLLVANENRNVQNALEGFKSQLGALDNKAAALARQGGTDQPAYGEVQGDIGAIYQELVADKRFKYPPERAAQEIAAMADRHKGEAIIGRATALYDKGTPNGAAQARKFLNDAAWDPSLNLSPSERQSIVTRGLAALEGRTSENKALVDANRKLVNETIEGLKTDAPYDERRINDLIDRAQSLGDAESLYKLGTYRALHDWRQGIKALPLGQQLSALSALRANAPDLSALSARQRQIAAAIKSEAEKQGVEPALAQAVGYRESSLNPDARSTTSSARGVYQMTNATRARYGLAEDASEGDQIAAGVTHIKDNISALKGALGRDPTPSEIYLAHVQGAAGAKALLGAAPGASLKETLDAIKPGWTDANGKSYGDAVIAGNGLQNVRTVGDYLALIDRDAGKAVSMFGGGSAIGKNASAARLTMEAIRVEAVNDLQKRMGGDVERAVASLETGIGKGRRPDAREIDAIAEGIRMTGRQDLAPRVETALAAADQAGTILEQPAGLRESFRARLQEYAATANPAERKVIDATEDIVKSVEAAMKSRPYSTGSARGLHNAPAPLVFDNPAALGAAFQQRSIMNHIHQTHDRTGPSSIFEGQEAEAFRGALTRADARTTLGMFQAFAKIDDNQMTATLNDETFQGAVQGALHTTDAAKYNAVMSSLNQLYARAPETFSKAVGSDAMHELMTWQAKSRYYDEQTLASERAKAQDPQIAERRKINEKSGRELARKMSVDEIVKQFDESWEITPGPVARSITGTQPLPPVDGLTRDALMGDYEKIFARRYADTLDKDVAAQQTVAMLKTKWSRSSVNGGRLMLRSPETVYPAIDDSHKWVSEQLESDLKARLGDRLGLVPGALGVRDKEGYLWDYTLVPDRRTETEAQRYDRTKAPSGANQPPSYLVVITDHRFSPPKIDAAPGLRWAADPAGDITRMHENFAAERQRILALGTSLGTP